MPRADVLGIELLPGGRVVLVGLRRNGQRTIPAFVTVLDSPEQLARDLKARRVRCRHISVCIPQHKCITKSIQLPSTETREIRSMLQFEVQGLVPLSEGRPVYSFTTSACADTGYTNAQVFLTRDSLLEEHIAPLLRCGVIPDRIVPASMALLAWGQAFYGRGACDSASFVLAASAAGSLDVAVVRGGELVYSRGVWLGGKGSSGGGGWAIRTTERKIVFF